jgi:type I restriction enzyme, S subunit
LIKHRVRIADIVVPADTWNPALASTDTPFDYIDISSVEASTKRIGKPKSITPSTAPSRARQLVKGGDVLVSTVRPNLNAVAIVPEHLDGATASTGFAVLRPNQRKVNPGYLFHWVRTPQFIRYLVAHASGANYPAVTETAVRESRLPLPPLATQEVIVGILDKADAIRDKRQEGLRLLNDLRESAFLEMFGNPITNPNGWRMHRLAEHLSFITSGSRGWARYYSKSGRPFLRIQNVGRNGFNLEDLAHVNPPVGAEAKRTAVSAGDILLSITADLGRTAVVTSELVGAHVNQHLAVLRVRDIEPLYLAQFLASEGGRRQFISLNRQAVKAGLNFDDIRSLRIPIPPRERQDAFSTVYRKWEITDRTIRQAAQAADQLVRSLAHRFFASESRN